MLIYNCLYAIERLLHYLIIILTIQLHLDRRVAGAFRVGAVLFSNQAGPLGQTETAAQLLQSWQKKEQ